MRLGYSQRGKFFVRLLTGLALPAIKVRRAQKLSHEKKVVIFKHTVHCTVERVTFINNGYARDNEPMFANFPACFVLF